MSRSQIALRLATLIFATIAACPLSAADNPPANKTASDKPDPYVVPDGTPKELAEYIKKLRPHLTRDVATATRAQKAILAAADKILAAKDNQKEIEFAVQEKMYMLRDGKQLAGFADELAKGGHAALARHVRGYTLQIELRNVNAATPQKKKAALADAIKFLEATPPEPRDLGLAYLVGGVAEAAGDKDLAIGVYRSLAKVFAASKDKNLAEFAARFEGVVRRIELPGNPMKIEGKLLDKTDFDWSKYSGKVVLVDFWATWCSQCVREIPNMKKCYQLYHAKGFEIVGVSCDRNVADLEKFVKEKKIPWPILFGDGKPSPTVAYYGIMSIPTMVLVDKDGKVVSLDARGESLKKELAKLLGPAEEKK